MPDLWLFCIWMFFKNKSSRSTGMFHWNPDYSDGQKVPKIPVTDQARPSQSNSEAQSK